jgi:dephospho-CoA kinase
LLRVGLTGGIGSGKSTIAGFFREQGVAVIEADAVGRELMQPGQSVYREIVEHFGPGVLQADGSLDRGHLAQLAFREGRLQELNALVHPAVIAAQEEWMGRVFARDPKAVAMIESALIFEASRGAAANGGVAGSVPGWAERFDRILLVTAPEETKIARYTARMQALEGAAGAERQAEIERDARARLARQIPDREKLALCDYVIDNAGPVERAREQVVAIAAELHQLAQTSPQRSR